MTTNLSIYKQPQTFLHKHLSVKESYNLQAFILKYPPSVKESCHQQTLLHKHKVLRNLATYKPSFSSTH